jgi:hypothetical protein
MKSQNTIKTTNDFYVYCQDPPFPLSLPLLPKPHFTQYIYSKASLALHMWCKGAAPLRRYDTIQICEEKNPFLNV